MGRLAIIDGFRGFFLFFMALVHFNGVLGTTIGKLNHHEFGWVEDAQGFVFISGLVVGLVYGAKYLKSPSLGGIYGPVLGRVGTIYLHQAALILMMLAAAYALGEAAPSELAPFRDQPGVFTASSLMLVSASGHMGILPMYVFFLLATPLAFVALDRGHVVPLALTCALLWLVAQIELVEMLAIGAQDLLARGDVTVRLGIYFNAFGWQVLFFAGIYFGFRAAQRKLDLSFLEARQFRLAFLMSLAAIVLLGIFDVIVTRELLGPDFSGGVYSRTSRGALSFIYPIAFALDLFVVIWLLRVGGSDPARWIRGASRGMGWLFTRRAFVFLGQHSLHVFSFHIIVYYALVTVMPLFVLGEAARTVVLLLAVGSLYLAAAGHAWLRSRDAARAPAAGAIGRSYG